MTPELRSGCTSSSSHVQGWGQHPGQRAELVQTRAGAGRGGLWGRSPSPTCPPPPAPGTPALELARAESLALGTSARFSAAPCYFRPGHRSQVETLGPSVCHTQSPQAASTWDTWVLSPEGNTASLFETTKVWD